MYSPKINETLIPALYRIAKDQGVPMTILVNRMIDREIRKQKRKNRKEESHESDINASGRRVGHARAA